MAKTCPSGRDDEFSPAEGPLFLISLPIQWMAQRKSRAMMKNTAAKINSRLTCVSISSALGPSPRQTK